MILTELIEKQEKKIEREQEVLNALLLLRDIWNELGPHAQGLSISTQMKLERLEGFDDSE